MAFDPNIRASDADRDRVASLLREHHAAGRLTAQEFSERLDRTFSAITVGELDELLADLPGIDLYRLPDAALTRQPRQARQSQAARENRGGRSAGWRAAWGVWFTVSLVSFVVWLLAGAGYAWPLWVAVPFGAVLAGSWLAATALGGGPARGLGRGSRGPAELPRADDDLPGRPGQ
jgi:Domain of unknown function (DUF1707)